MIEAAGLGNLMKGKETWSQNHIRMVSNKRKK